LGGELSELVVDEVKRRRVVGGRRDDLRAEIGR